MTWSCSQLLTKLTVLGSIMGVLYYNLIKVFAIFHYILNQKALKENALNKNAHNFPVPLSLSENLIRVPHYFDGVGLRVMKKHSGFCKSL